MTPRAIIGGTLVAFIGCLAPAAQVVAQNARVDESITAEQAAACIRVATSTRPGRVKSLDVDIEKGKLLCEVEIAGDNGRESEIHVDVATNEVHEMRD